MRLDFNALWVDDQPASVKAQTFPIARRMEDEGFKFNPSLCQSLDEVRKLIANSVFSDEIDLILVDWDLGAGGHGQDAIAAIRETVPFKDIIFYSAQTPVETLRRLAFENGIEGVFCVNREELVDEVINVFDSLVKKVLDLDHTRGIVMGATSDIDKMVSECLAAMHEKLDEAGKQQMLQEALTLVEDNIKGVNERAQALGKAKSMAAMFEAHLTFTSYDRLRILSRALKNEVFKVHAGVRPAVISYMEKVVPRRNDLGHLVLTPEGKPQAVASRDGKQVSIKEMRDLRRLILNLRHDFKILSDALGGRGVGASPGAKLKDSK
jgi:hypothetical protein